MDDNSLFDMNSYHTDKIIEYFTKQHYFDAGYKQGIKDYKEFIVNYFEPFVDNRLDEELGTKSKEMKALLVEAKDEILKLRKENSDLVHQIEVSIS